MDLESIAIPRAQPIKNLEALVGFVLEDCLEAESVSLGITKISMPPQFKDSGWNTENSFTWAVKSSTEGFDQNDARFSVSSPVRDRLTTLLIRFNHLVIQQSGSRGSFLCGRSVQELVIPTGCEETRLNLDAKDFPMFLDIGNRAIKRIYVQIPNPTGAYLLRDWRKTHIISEILRFTSAITRTVGLWPYASDNGCVLTKAIRDYMDERNRIQEPLTLETLYLMTRLWLTRKWFAENKNISFLQEE